MKLLLPLACSFAFVVTFHHVLALDRITHVNKRGVFVDSSGRERFFHGANVVYKGFPFLPLQDEFHPTMSFSQRDAEMFQFLGFNVMRLGVMWPGVEPTRGEYNQTYLSEVRRLMKMGDKHGIYSLLDMHQDVLSEKFCGEGVPLWAAQPASDSLEFPLPVAPIVDKDEFGVPVGDSCNSIGVDWPTLHFSQAVSTAFQAIYDNKDGLLDSFGKFWSTVASALKGNCVLGYELINEPWAGDVLANPSLLLPKHADRENLQHVYDRVSPLLRQADQDAIIFFESVTWDDIAVGFEHVPGGENFRNSSVLSYHYYQPPNLKRELHFAARQNDRKRLQCGAMLTEFDIHDPDEGERNLREMEATMDAAEDSLHSWIGWEYKPYVKKTGYGDSVWHENGTVNWPVAKALSRTYAQAVAGETLSSSFEARTGRYELKFIPSTSQHATVIFCNNSLWYPKGITVDVDDGGVWNVTWKESGSTLEIVCQKKDDKKVSNSLVTITVSPS